MATLAPGPCESEHSRATGLLCPPAQTAFPGPGRQRPAMLRGITQGMPAGEMPDGGCSDERITGVERVPERHPAVVLGRGVEVDEHMAGDGAHVAPAPLDRALVPQGTGPGHLHQVLYCPDQDAA